MLSLMMLCAPYSSVWVQTARSAPTKTLLKLLLKMPANTGRAILFTTRVNPALWPLRTCVFPIIRSARLIWLTKPISWLVTNSNSWRRLIFCILPKTAPHSYWMHRIRQKKFGINCRLKCKNKFWPNIWNSTQLTPLKWRARPVWANALTPWCRPASLQFQTFCQKMKLLPKLKRPLKRPILRRVMPLFKRTMPRLMLLWNTCLK